MSLSWLQTWILLFVVPFHMAITTTQSSDALYVVENLSEGGSLLKTLTCMSGDDDAALTWNYDLSTIDSSDRFNNFEPAKPPTQNFTDCAIWRLQQCSVSWAERSGWTVINSLINPMGPVVDYRWEGFREFVFNHVKAYGKYQKVLQLDRNDGTLVFSVRGTRDIGIYLCEDDNPTTSSCFLIKIAVKGTHSVIETCLSYAQHTRNQHCQKVDSFEHKPAVLDAYEWRTFRLQLISDEKLIKLFNGTTEDAFLQGRVRRWHSIGNIMVKSETAARIKFHFYEYYLATVENAVLSTLEFDHRDENFCVNMLVSLCPKCELSVSLTNMKNNRIIAFMNISGDEHFHSNGVRTWRSMRLNMASQIAVRTSLRLQIKSVLNEDDHIDSTWWAIDNLRICGATDGVRKSTITVPISTLTNDRSEIKCQKLFHNKIVVADLATSKSFGNTSQLRHLIQNQTESCPPGCTTFHRVYGNPASCRRRRDLKATVHPNSSGELDSLVSAPGKVLQLTLKADSAYTITGNWKPPSGEIGNISYYNVTIRRIKLIGCEDLQRTSPSESKSSKTVTETTASFSDLHPYAKYEFTVIANTNKPGAPASEVVETKSLVNATSKISDLRYNWTDVGTQFTWNAPDDCTTITGPANTTKLIFTNCSDMAINRTIYNQTAYNNFTLVKGKLPPGTRCTVRAYVIRDYEETINESNYQELNFTTQPAAPPAVQNLTIYEADAAEDTISVKWIPPYPPNGLIESYELLLWNENETISSSSIGISEVKKCTSLYVCIENFTFPSITPINTELLLQVFAMNKNVSEQGVKTRHKFKLNDLYNKAPSQPQGLRAITDGNRYLMLKWKHDPFTPTKLVRFHIELESLQKSTTLNPNMEKRYYDYRIREKKSVYFREFNLTNSTEYRVHLKALNYRNRTSMALKGDISVVGGVAAVGKEKLHIEHNETMIQLKVPTVPNVIENDTVVVIVQGLSLCKEKSSANISLVSNKTKVKRAWVAAKYQVNTNKPTSEFIFHENRHYGIEQNCSFQPQETYEFMVIFKNSKEESVFLKSSSFTFKEQNSSQDQSITWLIIIPILIIFGLIIFIWYRKRGQIWWLSRRSCDPLIAHAMNCSNNSLGTGTRITPQLGEREYRVSTQQNKLDLIPCDLHFDPVRVEELEQYIKGALASGSLVSQWEMIPDSESFLRPGKYGHLPQNMPKNQRNHAIPYDDNRIILEKVAEDPHSDYINASYIEGYQKVRAYIAAQGPKRDKSTNTDTVLDFWRMVWQEDVRVICMLTNLVEDGQRKCEQYWPEVGQNVEYGDSFVLNLDHQVFADYTIRTLQLICQGGKREIKHFHYTGWPEHGVPMFTQSLASFMKKLLATPVGKGPIVVHGSAGAGRTGTLILCDICLRQAVKERVIDIPTVTLRIRRDRANMVETVQQYLLAHLVIAECKILERTQVPCTKELKEKIKKLRKQLPSDVRRLSEIVWQDRALHSLATKPPVGGNMSSNRLLHPEQNDPNQVELGTSSASDGQRSFPAINVEGVQREKQYLAVRLPSPSTLPNFWSLVADKKIELIILLQYFDAQDSTKCDIAPSEPGVHVLCHIEVETKSVLEDGEYFTIKKLSLTDTSQDQPMAQPVTILTLTTWVDQINGTLPPVDSLVSLWMASEKVQRKEGPTLVICRDGVTGCGLYLALSFLLERMSLESVCDVITAVRAIQRSGPNFVQSLNQFEYLYDAAVNYDQRFDTYANFS